MRQRHIAGCLAFAFLALGASPAHYWLDAGEIAAAGADLGVMHPTGVPGLVPLLHAATAMPLGTQGLRMALVSAIFGAWAMSILFGLLERRQVAPAIAWGAVAWALAGLTFVRHARVVEIYAMAAWLAMVVLWGFDPRIDRERQGSHRLLACMAATVAAIGFGDLRLALGIPVFVVWVADLWRGRAWARWAPLVVTIAATVVASLVLASARSPNADWGDPQQLSRLWEHLQATSIRESYAARILPGSAGPWLFELGATTARLAEDLGPLGPALALGALLAWLRGPEDRSLASWVVFVVVVELVYAAGVNPMGGEDRQTGLVLALLAPLCVAVPLDRWTSRYPRARWAVLPLLAVALVVPPWLASADDRRTTASWAAHAWTRGALAQLPPDSLWMTQTDDLAAGVLAAQVIEGARPDVIAVPAQHLYRRPPERSRADPRLARVWKAAARGTTEPARVDAVLAAWPGPAAVESPGSAILPHLRWEKGSGVPPVSLRGEAAGAPDPVAEAFERWDRLLVEGEDRRRLAGALGGYAQVQARTRGRGAAGLEAAARTYRFVLERVLPGHVPSLVALASVYDRLGDTDSAIALTAQALEIEPDRPVALTNMALYLARDPARLGEARELAERATWIRPDQTRGWARLESICAAMGDETCSARARAELDARVPTPGAVRELGTRDDPATP